MEKENTKTVIYARVSSKEQEETGYSLPAQEKLLRGYAERNGLEIVKVFSVAESASGAKQRVVFAEMLSFLREKNVAHLLCEKVDRLTRNLKEAVEANDWIDGDSVRNIHFVKTNLVLNQQAKSDDKFRWDMEIVLAKKMISNLSEEVRKGQKEKIAQGWLPTKPPLGYKTIGEKGKKIHVVNEEIAPFIQVMFEEYARGEHTISSITDFVYERGLRSRGGRKIVRSRIHALLTDPFYYGDFRWKGKVYSGQHQAIITRELYQRVQDVLLNRNRGKRFKHDYLFKGMVVCRDCGGVVSWERQKGIVYGHCSAYRNCVKRPYYKESDFLLVVQEQLETLSIVSPRLAEWMRKALRHIHESEITRHDSMVRGLQEHQNRLRRRKSVLYEDRLDERISTEEYDKKSAEIDRELQEVESAMGSQGHSENIYYENADALYELAQKAGEVFTTLETKKQKRLLSLVCEEIYVEDGRLHLRFTEAFRRLKEIALKLNGSKHTEPVVSPIQIFELVKNGSDKEKEDVLVSSCSSLLRRQDSNLRPID